MVEAQRLLTILKTYETTSGQEIDLSKSEVFFSRNVSGAAQEDLSRIIDVRHVMGTGKYLGLPSMIGRDKRSDFSFIKDRIWKRINAWRGRALSKAGKEVMIKSVLQSIPSYIMSIYLLSNSVIDDIEKMIMRFGGEEGVTIVGLNVWHGNMWHAPKNLAVWGLGISKLLISLWWLSKDGVLCLNLNL